MDKEEGQLDPGEGTGFAEGQYNPFLWHKVVVTVSRLSLTLH